MLKKTIFIFLLITFPLQAATYFVAVNGSDDNTGTESLPFQTIGKGVSILTPGDLLYVKEGTYNEYFANNIPNGESWINPVSIIAYPGHTIVIKPTSTGPMGYVFYFGYYREAKHVIIDGFVIDGLNSDYGPIKLDDNSHHIKIYQL